MSQRYAHLQDSILGPGYRQLVQVELQAELVEVHQRDLAKRLDEVALNQDRFRLACLFFQEASLRGRKRFLTNQAKVTEPSFITLVGEPGSPICFVISR